MIWGAKEALFKLYGKGGVSFKEDLTVMPFQYQGKGRFYGKISKDDIDQFFHINYERIDNYLSQNLGLTSFESLLDRSVYANPRDIKKAIRIGFRLFSDENINCNITKQRNSLNSKASRNLSKFKRI